MAANELQDSPREIGLFARTCALLGLALIAWLPTLKATDWSADDPEVILKNPVVTSALPASDAFTRDYTYHLGPSGQWRPASALSLRLDHLIYGSQSSRGWHLTNLLLHLATIVLAARLAFDRFAGGLFLGLALYSVHPILADSVAWVSGRPSMVCAFLGIAGACLLHGVVKRGAAGTLIVGASILALLMPLAAKEDGALFALLLIPLAASHGRRVMRLVFVGCIVAMSVWLFIRGEALGAYWPTAVHPVLGDAPLSDRAILGLQATGEAFRLLWSPFERAPAYGVDSLPSPLAAATLLAAAFALLMAARWYKPMPLFYWALPLIAFIPFTHILPLGEAFAPRFMHLPLLLAIPLADHLLRSLPRLIPVGIFLALTIITWGNTQNYRDAEAYWLATLQRSPTSHVAWNALGLTAAEDGRHREAIASFQAALSFEPSHSKAWSNLARSYKATGKEVEAVAALEAAIRSGPNNPIAHTNWGLHLERKGSFADARDYFLRATDLHPGLAAAWDGLARTERHLGRETNARAAEERARSLDPR